MLSQNTIDTINQNLLCKWAFYPVHRHRVSTVGNVQQIAMGAPSDDPRHYGLACIFSQYQRAILGRDLHEKEHGRPETSNRFVVVEGGNNGLSNNSALPLRSGPTRQPRSRHRRATFPKLSLDARLTASSVQVHVLVGASYLYCWCVNATYKYGTRAALSSHRET